MVVLQPLSAPGTGVVLLKENELIGANKMQKGKSSASKPKSGPKPKTSSAKPSKPSKSSKPSSAKPPKPQKPQKPSAALKPSKSSKPSSSKPQKPQKPNAALKPPKSPKPSSSKPQKPNAALKPPKSPKPNSTKTDTSKPSKSSKPQKPSKTDAGMKKQKDAIKTTKPSSSKDQKQKDATKSTKDQKQKQKPGSSKDQKDNVQNIDRSRQNTTVNKTTINYGPTDAMQSPGVLRPAVAQPVLLQPGIAPPLQPTYGMPAVVSQPALYGSPAVVTQPVLSGGYGMPYQQQQPLQPMAMTSSDPITNSFLNRMDILERNGMHNSAEYTNLQNQLMMRDPALYYRANLSYRLAKIPGMDMNRANSFISSLTPSEQKRLVSLQSDAALTAEVNQRMFQSQGIIRANMMSKSKPIYVWVNKGKAYPISKSSEPRKLTAMFEAAFSRSSPKNIQIRDDTVMKSSTPVMVSRVNKVNWCIDVSDKTVLNVDKFLAVMEGKYFP